MGLSGIRLTCTQAPGPAKASTRASSSARQAWSLMSRIMAYSMETRRPVLTKYSCAAADHVGDRVAGVDRDQGVAQFVVRGVQRDREGDAEPGVGQLRDAGHQPDRGDHDRAPRDAEPVRRRIDQPGDGGRGGVVVRQRLPHPHEHDVGHAPGARRRPRRGPALSMLPQPDRRSRRSTCSASARPVRSRRTGSSCRNRPGRTRRPSPGRGNASGRSPPARRRTGATASCGWCRCRTRCRGPGSAAAGTEAVASSSRCLAGTSVQVAGSSLWWVK